MRKDNIRFQITDDAESDHSSPHQTIVPALEQLDVIFHVIRDQRRINVAGFVQDFDAIGLNIFIFVPEIFRNLADAGFVFTRCEVFGKFLVGNFIAAILKICDVIQHRHFASLFQKRVG